MMLDYFHLTRFTLPLAVLALTGCVGAPELGRKPEPVTAGKIASSRSLTAATDTAWPDERWWTRFGDPQLDSLIAEGLVQSPDVSIAAARFLRASGMVREAGAALAPTLDLQGKLTADKQSYNMGFPKDFVPKGWKDYGQIAGNLGFDLDIWGRNRAALAAATSQARAAEIDVRQARLALSTGIALAYFDLARLFAERDVRQAALDIREATGRLVAQRLANGLETRGNLRQTEALEGTARADLGAVDQMIALRRNQIAALIGAGPDRGIDMARPTLCGVIADGVPTGVTTDLVGRRPDIAAARARVEAAASGIDVAHADFFPAIRLNALVGLQALGVGDLIDSDSTFGSAGPAISLPIFRGGALKGRFIGARGSFDEAVASYDKTVIEAYRQVADAVTGQRLVDQRLKNARVALAASEDAYAIARLRYEGGLSNYLDVLDVEDRLLQARLTVAALDAEARALDVELVRALGGGFGGEGIVRGDPNG